jgi:hypothetical protein
MWSLMQSKKQKNRAGNCRAISLTAENKLKERKLDKDGRDKLLKNLEQQVQDKEKQVEALRENMAKKDDKTIDSSQEMNLFALHANNHFLKMISKQRSRAYFQLQ